MYGDLDYLADDGRLWPLAFPAFDYERMLEQGYCAHLFAVRRDALFAGLEARPDNLYRLFNCLLDHRDPRQANILHLPGALATLPKLNRVNAGSRLSVASHMHLRARGVGAEVGQQQGNLFPAIRIKRPIAHERVTVMIPTRDRLSLLRTCLDSISPAVERCSADILVIDNDSADPETIDYLANLSRRGIRTLRIEGPFNFARLNNQAAAMLDSDVLCLLNNDIEANSDDWLEEMLTRLAEPDVGAVGALLTWPGGVVQHGGVVLGMNFAATHAYTDRFSDDPGFVDQLLVAHECSALTAACLVTRRSDYLAIGGMDEARFAVAFNDVDYCLRLRQTGKRIVFTPHAKLVHAESASRGKDDRADRRDRFERELSLLRARWGELLNEDPTYNPQLSRDGVPYSGLAWPPGPRNPRYNHLPTARALPLGF
jgi:GT2 family glycosyltransferase